MYMFIYLNRWMQIRKLKKIAMFRAIVSLTYLQIAALLGKFLQFGVELLHRFLQIVDTLTTEIISTDELRLDVLNVTTCGRLFVLFLLRPSRCKECIRKTKIADQL